MPCWHRCDEEQNIRRRTPPNGCRQISATSSEGDHPGERRQPVAAGWKTIASSRLPGSPLGYGRHQPRQCRRRLENAIADRRPSQHRFKVRVWRKPPPTGRPAGASTRAMPRSSDHDSAPPLRCCIEPCRSTSDQRFAKVLRGLRHRDFQAGRRTLRVLSGVMFHTGAAHSTSTVASPDAARDRVRCNVQLAEVADGHPLVREIRLVSRLFDFQYKSNRQWSPPWKNRT